MPRTSNPRVNLEQVAQARTVKSVFVVQHAYELWNREDVKLIGVYGTRSEAEEAVDRARAQPGFCHWPDGFSVDEYALGKDHWTEGFARVVSIHVEVTGPDSSRFECVHAEWRPGDEYLIFGCDPLSEGEVRAFGAGQLVRCEEREIEGVAGCLVAVELAGGVV